MLCVCDKILQVAEMIRYVLDAYEQPIPAVLEIPSKDNPYDASKDSILRRAKVKMFDTGFLIDSSAQNYEHLLCSIE